MSGGRERQVGARIAALVVLVLSSLVAVSGTAAAGRDGSLGCDPSAAAAAATTGVTTNDFEREFIELLNGLRREQGRSTLLVNEDLVSVARDWSGWMADRSQLVHARAGNGIPQHLDYVYQTSLHVPNWRRAAENIGRGSSVRGLHDAFVRSQGHYANMVGDYNQVGIGVVQRGSTLWVTVRFAKGDAPTPFEPPVAPSNFASRPGDACVGEIPLSGDFDGNGYDDLLFYGPGGVSDGMVRHSANGATAKPLTINGVYRPFVADLDGDGRDDVIWYSPGVGNDYIWYGNSDGSFTQRSITVNGVFSPLVGDLDGDGDDDVIWYAPGTAADFIWYSHGRAATSVARTINGTYRPMLADYDGNGSVDVFWYAPGGASDFVWYTSRGRGVRSVARTVNGRYQPTTGDFDADGTVDIFWYAPGGAGDYLWYHSGSSVDSRSRPVNGTYELLTEDFDGNGTDDIFFFSPSAAADHSWTFAKHRGAVTSNAGRVTGDFVPATGDFDGDGRHDIYWLLPGTDVDVSWLGR